MLAGSRRWAVEQGDCLEWLASLPEGCATLAVTDPPFNIGLKYTGYHDRQPVAAFLGWLAERLQALLRVLTPTASLWVAMGPALQHRVRMLLEDQGWHWRGTVIWHYTFGPHQTAKWTPSYTPVHYMVRDPRRFVFDADAVRVPSARQTKYKDRRANPKGRVPDDVWTVSRVCGTFKERTGHVCQQPLALVERMILATSQPGDLVLDPFAGSGTTLAAAVKLGRRALGCELSEETAGLARGRITEMEEAEARLVSAHRVEA